MKLVDFKFIGAEKLTALLKRSTQKLQDRTTVHARAVVLLDRWIQKNFQTEGKKAQPEGWKPLSPLTIHYRRSGRKKVGGKWKTEKPTVGNVRILQDTGTMRSRWKHSWSSRRAVIQSGVDYATAHQFGAPSRNLPARPILPDEKQAWQEIHKVFEGFVREAIEIK